MRIAELDTPALLVDVDVMERNLARMADYTRQHGLVLRPHTKTHKMPHIGRRQLEFGAAGLTVAKVGEAEVMIESGTPDLLIEYPVVGSAKLRRLSGIARQARVTVAVDSLQAGGELSEAAKETDVEFSVLVEVDVGFRRVGVPPADAAALARRLAALPRLLFNGVSVFPGHIRRLDEHGKQQLDAAGRDIQEVLEGLSREGLPAHVVSGGNTPTAYHSHLVPGLTEIRAGTYVFNDCNTEECGACAFADCAATVLVTVVSTAVNGQAIVDGGSKTFAADPYMGSPPSFGHVLEAPEAVFTRMSEEHGILDITRVPRRLVIGERLRIIPNHICPAVNLHDSIYAVRGEEVLDVWNVQARGRLQ